MDKSGIGQNRVSLYRPGSRTLPAAIFVLSFSLLCFEVILTRLLSTVLAYHYVFAVASLALLGHAIGALMVFYLFKMRGIHAPDRSGLSRLPRYAAGCGLAMALSIPVLVLVSRGILRGAGVAVSLFFLMVPFVCAGAFLAELFSLDPTASGIYYGADMIGAACGCFASIHALHFFGAVASVFLFGAAAAVAGLVLISGGCRWKAVLGAETLIMIGLAAVVTGGYLSPPIDGEANPDKEIHDALSAFEGCIVETEWSAFGRTDLVEYPSIPAFKDIYLDGTAGTPMYAFSGDPAHPGVAVESLKKEFSGYFPFLYPDRGPKQNALMIGPGGGRDVLLALLGGVERITAVEVNRELIDLVRRHAAFNGAVYTENERFELIAEEGRVFLLQQQERYDLIFMSLPVTNTSRSREGYYLTENFLFTIESIGNYLDRLTDRGQLVVVTHNEAEGLRLITLALTALEKRGLTQTEAAQHFYLLGSDSYPLFALSRNAFTAEEIAPLLEVAFNEYRFNPRTSYFPFYAEAAFLNPVLAALGRGRISLAELVSMVAATGFDISPVSDNSPFFYKLETGLPGVLRAAFWVSLGAASLILLLPLLSRVVFSRRPAVLPPTRPAVLFALLGTGFMLVEVSLIQRFVFILGQPVFSMAAMLFALLLGTGLGSFACAKISAAALSVSRSRAALALVVLLGGYTILLPWLLQLLLRPAPVLKLAAAVALVLPLGFVMGMLFPLSLRLLKKDAQETYLPWMWAVNGAWSVFGSVLAVGLAICFGFTEVLLGAILCYLFVAVLSRQKGKN